jgi:hypothetical protein
MSAAADSAPQRPPAEPDGGPQVNQRAGDVGADDLRDAPLGHPTGHPDRYQPDLLFAVPREPQREAHGKVERLRCTGGDVWWA